MTIGHVQVTEPDQVLAPVVEDMSAYIIAGAVSSDSTKFVRQTDGRTPAQGIQDGVDAERLGFRRVWISERWDIKKADVILSAIAARTTRLEVATGVISPTTRKVWATASLAATMQACFGERFVLGLGRSDSAAFRGTGMTMPTYRELLHYADLFRRLWKGEAVSFEGFGEKFDHLTFAETYHGNPPELWLGGFAHQIGADAAAKAFDGVMLIPMFTPQATQAAVKRLRLACERVGRDPASLRICVPVVTAPELDELESRTVTAGRLVTYLTYPGYGEILAEGNGWDLGIVEKVRAHKQFEGLDRIPDFTFQRHELLGPASAIPSTWITDCCAVGSISDCVSTLQQFRDAGADEIATYGSTPAQNAALIGAWRDRPGQRGPGV